MGYNHHSTSKMWNLSTIIHTVSIMNILWITADLKLQGCIIKKKKELN